MEKVTTEGQYNAILISLVYECPFHINNMHCPLKEARLKDLHGKIKWLSDLPAPTKKTIYRYHINCFSEHQAQACAA
ncbi:MAG: hypothetical protein SD837_12850 [Candidatus Electrothrix scaldis]|nr:MAG: hypothetical protein SD837_12850 [Candidatus Electrothrix sp. GW3-3]